MQESHNKCFWNSKTFYLKGLLVILKSLINESLLFSSKTSIISLSKKVISAPYHENALISFFMNNIYFII